MPTRPPTLKVQRARAPRVLYQTQHKASARSRQASRALRTNSAAWRKIRRAVLREQPLCEHCAEKGRARAACEVDHRDGDTWNNARSNLSALCKPCHSRKTAKEQGGFGNRRTAPR